jgi:hypothetical protein
LSINQLSLLLHKYLSLYSTKSDISIFKSVTIYLVDKVKEINSKKKICYQIQKSEKQALSETVLLEKSSTTHSHNNKITPVMIVFLPFSMSPPLKSQFSLAPKV